MNITEQDLNQIIFEEIKNTLNEKCWKGYEKKGMKTMFGKRVPNCVKKTNESEKIELNEDELDEMIRQEIMAALEEKRKLTKKASSETSLRDWFKRRGAGGGKGGWVDCNAPRYKDGKKVGYKACGRQKGEKRSKYPACRPTAAACKDRGKGKKWGKKAARKRKK